VDAGSPPAQALDGVPADVVVAGFYRTCVSDQVLPASPADYVRRPNVPPRIPHPGLVAPGVNPMPQSVCRAWFADQREQLGADGTAAVRLSQ